MKIEGKAHKYGDDVNTDVIYPGKYTYQQLSSEEMASHALEDLDADFSKNVQPGDIIVAGKNFGCGSSREQAAACLKYAGVSAIIAESFSRIFFRNAINYGLMAIAHPEAAKSIRAGDIVYIHRENGVIKSGGNEFKFSPFPELVEGILEEGGLLPYLQKKLT
ncbi:3-isopropylmalate dehydratase [bacterium]|nr:MAG: 3-isopropylmalate dehydratase [bacterium]